jgi:hypothetical protein
MKATTAVLATMATAATALQCYTGGVYQCVLFSGNYLELVNCGETHDACFSTDGSDFLCDYTFEASCYTIAECENVTSGVVDGSCCFADACNSVGQTVVAVAAVVGALVGYAL